MWGEEVGGNSGAGSQRMKSTSAGAKKEGGQIRQKQQLEQRHRSGEAAGVLPGGLDVGWGGGKWQVMGLNKGIRTVFNGC